MMKRWIAGSLRFCCALISLVLWTDLFAASDCPAELPVNTANRISPLSENKLYTLALGAETRQVLLYWDDLPEAEIVGEAPALANRFIERLARYLQAMQAQGFRIPTGGAHTCVSGGVLRVYLYQTPPNANSGGVASGNRFDVYFSPGSADRGTIFEDTMPTLLHELFHLVQAEYQVGAKSRRWLSEGTATLASDVFDESLDNLGTVFQDSCRRQVLSDPFRSMLNRHSMYGDGTNSCQPVVLWRYLTEQLGTDLAEPGAGIGLIHELYEFLESTRGLTAWKTAPSDHIHGAGDFDGDGREELLLTSATHLGLLSSTQADSRVLAVRAFGYPIRGNWQLRASDQILGIGDFNADGRDEFLIRNGGFLALIGVGPDGELGAIAGVPLGPAVFADWRPSFRDQLLAIADFDGDGADEAMFRGRSRIGVIRLDRSGQFVSPLSTSIRRLARRLSRNPAAINVIGAGDIDGNGRQEIVARDREGLFVWGLDSDDRHQLLFAADYGERLGNRLGDQWLLSREDFFMGVHDLDGTVNDAEDDAGLRAEIVVTGGRGLGVLGMNAFSRQLETKATIDLGAELNPGLVFAADTRVVGIDQFLGPVGNQIMLRDGNELVLLEYDYQTSASGLLRTAAVYSASPGTLVPTRALRPQRLGRGRSEGRFNVVDRPFVRDTMSAYSAALAGRDGSHLMIRGPDRLHYFRAVREQNAASRLSARLLIEHRDIDGQYQKSLVQALDQFIRHKDPSRSLTSMWHDLSLMLLVKNSIGASMGERFFLRDELPPGVAVDVDADSNTPPVALVFDPIEQTRGADGQTVFLGSSFLGRPFSAQYWFVKPAAYDRQVDLQFRNLTTERWFSQPAYSQALFSHSSVSLLTAVGHQVISMARDLNQPVERIDNRYRLAAGQWMGIVVSTADAAHPQSLSVGVERLLPNDE